MNSLRWT